MAQGSVSLPGLISQPRGEQVREHIGTSEEASSRTLANRPVKGPSSPHRASGEGGDTDPCATREQQQHESTREPNALDRAGAAAEPEPIKLVRATSRWTIDLRRRPDAKDKAWADDLHTKLLDARRASAQAANTVVRACWRVDGDAFDAAKGRVPHAGWPSGKLNLYQLVRTSVPGLNVGIAAAVARAAGKKWAQCRSAALVRQEAAPPFYRLEGAFPLRAQEVSLVARPIGEDREHCAVGDDASDATKPPSHYFLRFSLLSGPGGRIEVPMVPRDDRQRLEVEHLASGAWKLGDVRVEQDRLRPRKWYLRVAYTRLVPKKVQGTTAAINRGLCCFLAAVTSEGDQWLYDGEGIVAHLAAIQKRRRQYQRDSKASARWGHGRARTLRPIERLSEAATNWRSTRNQVIARRLCEWLVERHVCRVWVEDFTGIRHTPWERLDGGKWIWDRIQEWPCYDLLQRLMSCLEERGIECVIQHPAFNSQTMNPHPIAGDARHAMPCPKCGTVDKAFVDLRSRRLRCTGCSFSRHLDVAYCMNALARGRAVAIGGSHVSADLADSARPGKGGGRQPPGKSRKSLGGDATPRNGKK